MPPHDPTPGSGPPGVVVVGAASRDRVADDPRGWRLGGAVSYGALAIARLGLRVAALVGTDAEAADAEELDTLREAGVDVRVAALASGPVFDNIEEPGGRRQVAYEAADPLPVEALPPEWRSAPAWLLGPVAGELPDAWADVPSEDALVAIGWQGLLRDVRAGEPVRHLAPGPSPLLRRADIVAVSGTDFGPDTRIDDVCAWLRPGATLLVTSGADGRTRGGGRAGWPAPPASVPRRCGPMPWWIPRERATCSWQRSSRPERRPDLVGGRIAQRYDLLLAARRGVAPRRRARAGGRARAGMPSGSAWPRRPLDASVARPSDGPVTVHFMNEHMDDETRIRSLIAETYAAMSSGEPGTSRFFDAPGHRDRWIGSGRARLRT